MATEIVAQLPQLELLCERLYTSQVRWAMAHGAIICYENIEVHVKHAVHSVLALWRRTSLAKPARPRQLIVELRFRIRPSELMLSSIYAYFRYPQNMCRTARCVPPSTGHST